MERLGQDHLDVGYFQRRGLLRDREVVFKPLLGWPRVFQIRVSRYRLLVEYTESVSATDPAILDALSFWRISSLVQMSLRKARRKVV
jgi:hypothetical protein